MVVKVSHPANQNYLYSFIEQQELVVPCCCVLRYL